MKKIMNKLITCKNLGVINEATLWVLIVCAYTGPQISETCFYKGICMTLYILLLLSPLMMLLLLFKNKWSRSEIVKKIKTLTAVKRISWWDICGILPLILVIPLAVNNEILIDYIQVLLVPLIVFLFIIKKIVFKA